MTIAEQKPDKPLVEIEAVEKIFKTPAGDFPALKGVSARFYPGEFVSIVGKSGSGKSTLANMITGIDHPTAGSVRIAGTEVHGMNEGQMSAFRGQNLGIVFQFFQLLPMLSLLENVMLPMDFSGTVPAAEREERAMRLLALVGLESVADKLPAAVSGGQQQTAAIARALANDPPLLIADEPTGNLDSRTAETVFEIFGGLAAQGKTIIMVTHDPSLAARTMRVLEIADGLIVSEYRPDPSTAQGALEGVEAATPQRHNWSFQGVLNRLAGVSARAAERAGALASALVPVFNARRPR